MSGLGREDDHDTRTLSPLPMSQGVAPSPSPGEEIVSLIRNSLSVSDSRSVVVSNVDNDLSLNNNADFVSTSTCDSRQGGRQIFDADANIDNDCHRCVSQENLGAVPRWTADRGRVIQVNIQGPEGEEDDQVHEKDLRFASYYVVLRFSRNLKRSEVMAFGFINLCIICIALLAQLGMTALGYYNQPEVNANLDPTTHPARSFSWKMISEYYISDSLSNLDRDCLYFNKKRFLYRKNEDPAAYLRRLDEELEKVNLESVSDNESYNSDIHGSVDANGLLAHVHKCTYQRVSDVWSWLSKFITTMFLPILSITCALIFLFSISCRRKKGLQFMLLVPAFICFFMDIFQTIPATFHYYYANMVLMEEMQSAVALTMPPFLVSPIWEETQIHGQCCGINSYATWTTREVQNYPRSCCNITAFDCSKDEYPTKDEVWKKGCFEQEYNKIRHVEFYTFLLLLLKLVAEIGIFWSVSDLTRHDYPPPEQQHNSTCDMNDFEVRTRGMMHILGVTERRKMVIKFNKYVPGGRIRFSNNRSGNTLTIFLKYMDKVAGSIEMRRQRNVQNRNLDFPPVDLLRGRNRGLVFITF